MLKRERKGIMPVVHPKCYQTHRYFIPVCNNQSLETHRVECLPVSLPVVFFQVQQMAKVLTKVGSHRLEPAVEVMFFQLGIPLVASFQRRM